SETHRDWSHFNRFGPQDQFVQQRVQAAHISTLSVQGHWYFFRQGLGMERGFDVVDTEAAPKAVAAQADRSVTSDKLSDRAIGLLSKPENAGRQFYLWVHYVDPHSEYVRHPGFDFGPGNRDLYEGEVAFTDHHVGRLLDFIEKSSFADRTAVIFTSDHGEAFGEHGMIRHGFELWEELVRVPLIFRVPGAAAHKVFERRSIIDVVPTILDLLRVAKPTGVGSDFLSGESLLFDLLLPPSYQPPKRVIFVDMAAGPHNAERQAFIENDYKLIASSSRVLGLYHLSNDPGEKHDLSQEHSLTSKIADRFRAFRRTLREVHVAPTPE
ncbi:MAG TPA: sulfatase-like hydrolase/transferase, partial [Polyangiaceae bacterium]